MPPRANRRTLVARLPRLVLRVEGLAVAAGALALYFDAGYDWLLLVVLVLAPRRRAARLPVRPACRLGCVQRVAHIGAARRARRRRSRGRLGASDQACADLARAHRRRPARRLWPEVRRRPEADAPAARLNGRRAGVHPAVLHAVEHAQPLSSVVPARSGDGDVHLQHVERDVDVEVHLSPDR